MPKCFLSFFLLLSTGLIYSQSNVFTGTVIEDGAKYKELKENLLNYEIYEIDANAMLQYFQSSGTNSNISLKLGNSISYNLNLNENRIFKTGIKPRVLTENGLVYGELTKLKCFQGIVQGSNKRVSLSVKNGFLSGYIGLNDDKLYFEPLRFMVPGAPDNYFIFYHSKDYIEKKSFHCLAIETEEYKNNLYKNIKKIKNKAESSLSICKQVEVAEASDKLMCTHYGSVGTVQDRIASIINDIQSNYCCDFDDELSLIISDWYNVECNSVDPWSNTTDATTFLNEFTAWGPSNFSQHDVGQCFTYRDFDGSTVGIAWVATVCGPARYSCIQDWSNNADLMRVTVAHEIGHNFSCVHDAPGTQYIMSPVANNTNQWSGASIDQFNYFVPTRTCLDNCPGTNPPIADFSSNTTLGCKPLTVNFTDISQYTPTSWLWSFPGGNPSTSTLMNPVVVYNAIGVYDVSLTVTNSYGTNSITKTAYLTVIDKPVANFTFVKAEGNVQFTNTSTGLGSSHWDFGDGTFSNDKNPVHTYSSVGTYNVLLTVSNLCGVSIKSVNITVVFIPVASFSADVNSGCVPIIVNFTDLSTNNPTSWNWSFIGGYPPSSTLKNPTITYNNPGDFKVSLVATNSEGSGSVSIDKYIKVNVPPVANFSFSVVGHKVHFMNTTAGVNNSFLWDFGDGETSIEVNPIHTYALPGDYTVSLTATNSCSFNSISKSVTVHTIPTANFKADTTTACSVATIHFTDISYNSPDTWKWTFPGGTPDSSTMHNPTVEYQSDGTYAVVLIASNDAGSDTIIKTNYIHVITHPFASFTSIVNGNTAIFTNITVSGISYNWDFGDGNTSSEINPVHAYAQENNYTVRLIATNSCGSDTVLKTITIVFPPTAGFSANVTSGCEPLTVLFNNISSANASYYKWSFPGGSPDTSTLKNPIVIYNSAGNYDVTLIAGNSAGADTLLISNYITVKTKPVSSFNYLNHNYATQFNNTTLGANSYQWVFGDGDSSKLKDPTHLYKSPGEYMVKLIAVNECGTGSINDTILVVFPPAADFSSNGNAACNNASIQFVDLSGTGASSWQWSFPGGSPNVSNLQNPIVSYTNAGSYDVTLIASNSGGSDTLVKTGYILISIAPPVANFSYSNFGLSYNFSNLSTDAYSYKWDFGDGGTSTQTNPDYNYQTNGSYTVKLIALNGCGSDTFLLGVIVVGSPPLATFESNINSGCVPLTINFKDKSKGGATSWQWSFPGGDPLSSTDQNPVVTYNTAGTYDVSLISSNSFGSDTINETAYITVKSVPDVIFSYTSLGKQVTFTNNSTGGISYLWDFGDGTTSTELNPVHIYNTIGSYAVSLTVTNECGSFSFTQIVDVKVNVNEIGFIEGISIYPNPNKGLFSLSIRSKQKAVLELKVIDMLGRTISELKLEVNEGDNTKDIKLEKAVPGQYLIFIKSETQFEVEKIIVE